MALVAQLDRVLPSEGKGREFESRQVRHIKISTQVVGIFICCTRRDERSRSEFVHVSGRRRMRRSECNEDEGVYPRATSPSAHVIQFFDDIVWDEEILYEMLSNLMALYPYIILDS